jgi:hypothetical protein
MNNLLSRHAVEAQSQQELTESPAVRDVDTALDVVSSAQS